MQINVFDLSRVAVRGTLFRLLRISIVLRYKGVRSYKSFMCGALVPVYYGASVDMTDGHKNVTSLAGCCIQKTKIGVVLNEW